MSDPPEVVEMTPEQAAVFYTISDAPTRPGLCTCGHEGLGMAWHLRPCVVSMARWMVRDVLARDE